MCSNRGMAGDVPGHRAGRGPGEPVPVTQEAAVERGAPGAVRAGTIRKPAGAVAVPGVRGGLTAVSGTNSRRGKRTCWGITFHGAVAAARPSVGRRSRASPVRVRARECRPTRARGCAVRRRRPGRSGTGGGRGRRTGRARPGAVCGTAGRPVHGHAVAVLRVREGGGRGDGQEPTARQTPCGEAQFGVVRVKACPGGGPGRPTARAGERGPRPGR